MGRFTQIDPIGFAGGLNLYGYANGDPVNFRDPSGLSADTLSTAMIEALGEFCELIGGCEDVNIVVVGDDGVTWFDKFLLKGVEQNDRALAWGMTIYFPREQNSNDPRDVHRVAHELFHVFHFRAIWALQRGSGQGIGTNYLTTWGSYLTMGGIDQTRYELYNNFDLGSNPYQRGGLLERPAESAACAFFPITGC